MIKKLKMEIIERDYRERLKTEIIERLKIEFR